jgi:hypothetical protein
MKTPKKEVIVHDEFEYNGIDYELVIRKQDRVESGGMMVEPEQYQGTIYPKGNPTDMPPGIQRTIEIEKVSDYYEKETGTVVEQEISPAEIAEELLEDLRDVWESYDTNDLDDLGVEVPAEPEI